MSDQILIPVFAGAIRNEQTQITDARTLHRFLEVSAHFRTWIARRIDEYGFQEGEDFRSFLGESSGGRRSREYHITLDMGKELAMVERNEKGRQARRYFIECEKRLQQIAPREVATIRDQTIGVEGFGCLASVLDIKVRHLPVPDRRGIKNHIWSQLRKSFGVATAKDIPATELADACNFVAAYALEGEWLAKEVEPVFDDWLNLNCLITCMQRSYDVFTKYNLYAHLTGLGSRSGIEIIDYLADGRGVAGMLKREYAEPLAAALNEAREICDRALSKQAERVAA